MYESMKKSRKRNAEVDLFGLDRIRNTALSSILFIKKNSDSLKVAEQQQICWGKQ